MKSSRLKAYLACPRAARKCTVRVLAAAEFSLADGKTAAL
jgi:hypothetical protein